MTFRVCTVGCGSMATNVHGPSYRKYAMLHPDFVLAACCDLDQLKAETFRHSFGFEKSYTDINLMLDIEKPNAVCLVVPEHLTAQISLQIMEKGYPLIMEKPPGLTMQETALMIKAADHNNIPTQVAFNRRYMPLVKELKKMLKEQFVSSSIHHIRYDFYRVGRLDSDFAATAIHGIDTVKHLAGSDYASIQFQYQRIAGFGPEVVNISMNCKFESGTKALVAFYPVSGVLLERATLQLYDHSFFLNLPVGNSIDYPGSLIHYKSGILQHYRSGDDLYDEVDLFVASGFYDENASFFDAIQTGIKPAGDLKSALQSVEIADCIRNRIESYTRINGYAVF